MNMKQLRLSLLLAATAVQLVAIGQWNALGTGLSPVRSVTTFSSAIYAAHNGGVSKSVDNGTSFALSNTGITLVSGQYNVRSVGHNATYLFAGTQSGIYRSTDGATWTNVNGTLTASAQVYATKFFHFGVATFAIFTGSIANGGGIHRTNDSGTTWLIGNSGMGSNAIAYDIATNGTDLYAATSVGLYKSTDGGQQWSSVAGSNFAIYAVQVLADRLVAVTTFGYRYSLNYGATSWSESTGDPTNPTKGEMVSYDGKIYALSNQGGCTVSLDNGVTYSSFNTGLTPVDQVAQEKFHASGTRLYLGALQDLYYVNGTTVGMNAVNTTELPSPYPSLFTDGFFVDLTSFDDACTVVLIDASGKEVTRQNGAANSVVHVERNGLASGHYRCFLIESNGNRALLGTVIAE